MNEDYVSFEVAKLLKGKGFDWKCENRFVEKIPGTEREEWDEDECAYVTKTNCNIYPKPTLYMVHKWLRETKNIHIDVYRNACGWLYSLTKADSMALIGKGKSLGPNYGCSWDTYEEALCAGILYALKSI